MFNNISFFLPIVIIAITNILLIAIPSVLLWIREVLDDHCISFEKFETSNEAISELKKTVSNHNNLFNNHYADLKGINKRQLEEIGVEKFDICPFCTILDNDKFFSYRKENQTQNRHSAVIKLSCCH